MQTSRGKFPPPVRPRPAPRERRSMPSGQRQRPHDQTDGSTKPISEFSFTFSAGQIRPAAHKRADVGQCIASAGFPAGFCWIGGHCVAPFSVWLFTAGAATIIGVQDLRTFALARALSNSRPFIGMASPRAPVLRGPLAKRVCAKALPVQATAQKDNGVTLGKIGDRANHLSQILARIGNHGRIGKPSASWLR